VLGAQQVGVGHPQRLEDAVAKVAVDGLSANVIDDLTEGGDPVVAEAKGRARLQRQSQRPG